MTKKKPPSRDKLIKMLKELKQPLKERFGVNEFFLFGAFARDEGTEDCDVDILAYFDKLNDDNFFGAIFLIEDTIEHSVYVATEDVLELPCRVEREKIAI